MPAASGRVPLVDLVGQYRAIKPDIDAAIQRVLERGQFILGAEGHALERDLAAYCGTREAVGVASGTDALELALRACGVGPGDEVITTALSFFATVEAILAVGATPVFVDIEPRTYTIDPALISSKLSARTKAILPVHLYGHPCDMDAILQIAQPRQLHVIEDRAQALGAEYRSRRVGSFGTAGCLSFFPTKHLGAYGDGGMVVTNSTAVAEQIRLLRVHGSAEKYHHRCVGTNSRLDELQAAILRVKLPYLNQWNEARRAHVQTYRQLFHRAGLQEIVLPSEQPGCYHVYQLCVIRLPERDRIAHALTQQDIGVQITYPLTLPQQPALAFLGDTTGQFPVAERATRDVLSLPLYPELTPGLIEQIVLAISSLHPALSVSR